jgi:hypothetical protein
MRWKPVPLLLAALALGSCSDNPATLEDAANSTGSAATFDRLAEQYLGNSLAKELSQREFSPELARRHPHPGRYPLQLGNRWLYRRIVSVETTLNGEEPTHDFFRARAKHEIVGTERLFDRSYTVEERTIDEGELGTSMEWRRYRQDRSGLYEADVSVTEPPVLDGDAPLRRSSRGESIGSVRWDGSLQSANYGPELATARAELERKLALARSLRDRIVAPAELKDALENELTRLSYPIVPGKSWTIREFPLVTFTVEGVQIVRLPGGPRPAWRLRLDAEFLGPDDRAVFWLGRVGFLGYALHFEADVVDISGNVVGTLRGLERELLRSFEPAPRR